MDAPLRYELLALHGSDEIGRWSLPPGVYTVGRSRDCSISLEADGVQDEHARLSIGDDGSISLDVGLVGACVDGSSVTGTVRVQPEQYIDLGSISLLLQTAGGGGNRTVSLAAAPEEDDEVPAEFRRPDRYEPGRQIAKGGVGAILNVRQSAIRRSVAMKVILDYAEEDPRQRLRFIEEAQITGQLEHPNIVPVHDAGIDAEGRIFYTMKLVRGITLKKVLQLLKEREPGIIAKYPFPALLTVFIKVCDALAFAHSKGVLHRDIKPENIMIGSYGEVLLMDWGLAKLIGAGARPAGDAVLSARAEAADAFATMQGSIMGTPNYMSPEQARGEVEQLDARSDLFSLGIVLHELLTLERPFIGKTAQALLDRIASGDAVEQGPLRRPRQPGELPHLPQGVPESLAAVVLKALAPLPAERYQSVKELQAELAAYQNGFATGAERASSWTQLKLLIKRHRAASLGIAAVLFVGATLGTKTVIEGRRAELALRNLKQTAPAILQLAEGEAEVQQFEAALRNVAAALALDPELKAGYWKQVWLLLALQRYPEAAAAFRTAQQRDPGNHLHDAMRPVLDAFATAPDDTARFTFERTHDLYDHLSRVGASGEMTAFSQRLKLKAEERAELVRARLKGWLGPDVGFVNPTPEGGLMVGGLPPAVDDLERLRGLPINVLHISGTKVTSLAPLSGMPLTELVMIETQVSDLTPLRGMRLTALHASGSLVSDLSPLAGMPLRTVYVSSTKITSLAALKGAPVERFSAASCRLTDFSPLNGAPLREVQMSENLARDLSFLSSAPVETLSCGSNHLVADLEQLRGKPLKFLELTYNPVANLRPLAGAPITELSLTWCPITDYKPLLDLPKLQKLRVARFDELHDSIEALRAHPTLETVALEKGPYRPVAEFWKEYEAQKAAGKK